MSTPKGRRAMTQQQIETARAKSDLVTFKPKDFGKLIFKLIELGRAVEREEHGKKGQPLPPVRQDREHNTN